MSDSLDDPLLCIVCRVRVIPPGVDRATCSDECERSLERAPPALRFVAMHRRTRRAIDETIKTVRELPKPPQCDALRDARLAIEATIDRVKQARADGTISVEDPSHSADWSAYECRLRAVASFLEALEKQEPKR